MQDGRDEIVADTVHTNAAIPDMRLVADEVVWAGDEARGFERVWDGRDVAVMAEVHGPGIEVEMMTGRAHHDQGQPRSHVVSVMAMFPSLAVRVDDLSWMGSLADGHLLSVRWGAVGARRGHGSDGTPTGREVHVWGITQWHVERTAAGMRVRRE